MTLHQIRQAIREEMSKAGWEDNPHLTELIEMRDKLTSSLPPAVPASHEQMLDWLHI